MKRIEQTGSIDDTIILFISDNGFRPDENQHERHNRRSKLSVFEDGLRTPILISWNGKVQPTDHPQLVQTVDLVPTVLSAAGLPKQITPEMNGIDLMPSARGRVKLPARPAFGAIYPNDAQALGNPSQHVRARWVRQGDFKLIVPAPTRSTLPLMLFDLEADPLETRNRASKPDYADKTAELKSLLDQWWKTDKSAISWDERLLDTQD